MLPIIHKKLRKDKEKQGKHPVILQVYFNGQRKQIFTGLHIDAKFWDEELQQATRKLPEHDWFNRALKNKYAEVENDYLKQSVINGSVSIERTIKQSRKNFTDYATAFFNSKSKTCTPTYINKCNAAVASLQAFTGVANFQDITPQVLKNFEDYLFKKGLQRNTINGIHKRIKQVFKQAIKDEIIDKSPYNIYKSVTYKQTKREYLTLEEIDAIAKVEIPKGLEHIRNYFLLSCNTGLRFSDLQNFDKKKLITKNKGVERIIIGTTKTGEMVSIKLSENVKSIIDKINKPLPTNVHTNRLLNIIAKAAGIDRRISYHASRHSAAVNMASAGLSIEVVARLLGHTDVRTTAIYFKIVDSKLDDAMDQFDKFLGG